MQRLFFGLTFFWLFSTYGQSFTVPDPQRQRQIPVSLYYPLDPLRCSPESQCQVAVLSAGYRVPYQHYQFLVHRLQSLGFLVIMVDHEVPGDPPLSRSGDLFETRVENWLRGAQSLNVVYQQLSRELNHYDFTQLTLVGHSNGGDISAWFTKAYPERVKRLITLDHKRVPLPQFESMAILALTSPEYPIKVGVLPNAQQQTQYRDCVVSFADAKHMDFSDYGSAEIRARARAVVTRFVAGEACSELRKAAAPATPKQLELASHDG